MTEGWIKLHRKFNEWEWYNKSEMVHLFIHLLINANSKDGEWQGQKIKRGQILTSLNALNSKTKISLQTIRTCLKKMILTHEINIQTNKQNTLITICKYDNYQGEKEKANTQTNTQLTIDQQATNTKQEVKKLRSKEVKNKEEELIKEIDILPDFIDPFKNWLQFKRLRGESYKDKQSTFLAYKKLLKLSENNSIKAVQIIEESMANNWAGLFPLKPEKNGSEQKSNTVTLPKY